MKSLFEVWKKDGMALVRTCVYAVRNDKAGYPHFLIYENGQWKYISAKHFIPLDEG